MKGQTTILVGVVSPVEKKIVSPDTPPTQSTLIFHICSDTLINELMANAILEIITEAKDFVTMKKKILFVQRKYSSSN